MTRLLARVLALALAIGWGHALPHGALDERIAAVTRSLEREPSNASLFLRRGELHRQHRDWAAALADYDKVAQLDVGNTDVLLARARLANDRGVLSEALSTLDRYLSLRPGTEVALALRADVNDRIGRSAAAADDYATVLLIAVEPRVEYFLGRAAALAKAGDDAGALAAADAGIGRLGSLITLQQWAIEHLIRVGRVDEALARLDATLAAAQRRETGLTRRAEILGAVGRRDEAQASFASARTAWDALPERLRATPAMRDLRQRIEAGMAAPVAP